MRHNDHTAFHWQGQPSIFTTGTEPQAFNGINAARARNPDVPQPFTAHTKAVPGEGMHLAKTLSARE